MYGVGSLVKLMLMALEQLWPSTFISFLLVLSYASVNQPMHDFGTRVVKLSALRHQGIKLKTKLFLCNHLLITLGVQRNPLNFYF